MSYKPQYLKILKVRCELLYCAATDKLRRY